VPVRTILIVDDNTIQREGLAVVLRQHGFSILSVSNGQEALDLIQQVIPDLILLDMLIPNNQGDGWWFLQRRRQTPTLASIPILITTALPIASQEWANSLGANGLIRKPIEVEPLLTAIRSCLGQQ
jgi:CheY-like chemotaxis protein